MSDDSGKDRIPPEDRLRFVFDRTYRQGVRLDSYLNRATAASEDVRRAERIEKSLCKICMYIEGGGMSCTSITNADCRFCGAKMVFGSSFTDDLCPDCAKTHRLCKHCMADVDFKKRRKL